MVKGRRIARLLLAAGALVVAVPLPAAAQRVQSNVVLVREDDVITEDLYAAGNSVLVAGTVEGDLVAAAFDLVRIEGVVEGDVLVVADRVEITGDVRGALRVIARTAVIEGRVGDDVLAGAWQVATDAGSSVGRDLVVFARRAETLGAVGRNLEGTQHAARIGGRIAGDVEITAREVSLLPGLRVEGDLAYTSDSAATVAADAEVGGTLVRAETLPPNIRVRAVRLLATLLVTAGALGLGLGILWASPDRSIAAATVLRRSPLSSLAWGIGVVSVPVALVIVAAGVVAVTSLSSSGPVLLVLIPVAGALGALVGFGLLAAPVPAALVIGGRLRDRWSTYARFVVGFAVLALVRLLPWVGGLLLLIVLVAGLGAWLAGGDRTGDGR